VSLDDDLMLFHRAFRRLIEEPDRVLAEHGLGRVHHRVLFVIARAEAISVGDVAGTLAITRQALHEPLRELRERALVVSEAAPDNRAVQHLRLTKKGSALERTLTSLQRDHLTRAYRSAGAESDSGWRRVMNAIADTRSTE
jgi:DNA-binding MarR family transcriptional regulator